MATSEHRVGLLGVDSASSVSGPAAVRSAVDASWRRPSVAGCSGDSIAVITAAHYGCFTLRPAIAEARTLVCELPVLAGWRQKSGLSGALTLATMIRIRRVTIGKDRP